MFGGTQLTENETWARNFRELRKISPANFKTTTRILPFSGCVVYVSHITLWSPYFLSSIHGDSYIYLLGL
jgi:hypothetical protein